MEKPTEYLLIPIRKTWQRQLEFCWHWKNVITPIGILLTPTGNLIKTNWKPNNTNWKTDDTNWVADDTS